MFCVFYSRPVLLITLESNSSPFVTLTLKMHSVMFTPSLVLVSLVLECLAVLPGSAVLPWTIVDLYDRGDAYCYCALVWTASSRCCWTHGWMCHVWACKSFRLFHVWLVLYSHGFLSVGACWSLWTRWWSDSYWQWQGHYSSLRGNMYVWLCSVALVECYSLFRLLAGLTVGDPVLKTGKPLSVELGPGRSTTCASVLLFCF